MKRKDVYFFFLQPFSLALRVSFTAVAKNLPPAMQVRFFKEL